MCLGVKTDRQSVLVAASAEDGTEEDLDNFDDEYALAGVEDPKILLTTSRDPSSKLQQFAKVRFPSTCLCKNSSAKDHLTILQEMRLCFPNATRINRGNFVMKELAETCRANNATDLVVLHEHRGVPDAMVISHFPHGPTILFTLHNVVLRHDSAAFQQGSTVSEQYPHLIFENFSSKLGHRVKAILKYCFPVPRADSKRVMTFNNDKDFISYRHHVFVKTGHNEVQIAEVGPRFEMRRKSLLTKV